MTFENEVDSGFRPRDIHPRHYDARHLFESFPEVASACERFRDYYGGSYMIDRAKADILGGRLPSDLYNELKSLAVKDKWLLAGFLPDEIVAAFLGEDSQKRHYRLNPGNRKKS